MRRPGTVADPGIARLAGPSSLRLVLLCAAQSMLIVDVVVVNVALPAIRTDLAVPDSRLPLVSLSYTLAFGSLLIVFGRAGDLLGRRRLFLTGLATFTAASLATGLAQAEWQLVAAWASQGVGAAMVSPTALAMLTTAFREGASRNRALGWWAAVGSGGAVAGQLVGGVITDAVGWRGTFLVNVPIGVVTLALARRPASPTATRDSPPGSSTPPRSSGRRSASPSSAPSPQRPRPAPAQPLEPTATEPGP